MTTPILDIPSHIHPDRVIDFDMFNDPRLHEDMHDGYLRLMREAPDFFYTPRNGGHWVALRQQEILDITRDFDNFTSYRQSIPRPDPKAPMPRIMPVDMDPPDHAPYRKVLAPLFAPKAVESLEADTRKLAIDLIDKLNNRSECEFIESVAMPMPVILFMRMMGMDMSRYEEFVGWVDDVFNCTDTQKRSMVYMKTIGYLVQLVKARQANPENDWVSKIINSEVDGKKLPFDAVLAMCLLLFVAGLDTVTNGMGFIVRALAEDKNKQRLLREKPEMIPEAVEELLRRYGFANTIRMVKQDTTYKGIVMKQGEPILLCLPTAGLDASFNDRPMEVDLERPVKQHYAFGVGIHRCAGSHLARVELKVFLEEWLKRIPEFELKKGTRPVFRPGIVMGITKLELSW